MFATIQDLYIRFGRENVLAAANLDGLDTTDPANIPEVEIRIAYFLGQAYDLLANALRQGSYNPEDFCAPYPPTLVNANCEIAFVQIYRTRHTEDETTPDAYRTIEENNFRLIRDIQGGAIRFDTSIPSAMRIPTVTRSSLPGFSGSSQNARPPARVNGILPDRNGNIVIDEFITSAVFNSYMNSPYLATAGKTYVDIDLGREGYAFVDKNGLNRFVTIATGGGGGGTDDYRLLTNKPAINSVELAGNKTAAELGLVSEEALANKANKILVATEWDYTLENIADVPVADGDMFQIITGNEEVPELILYVSQVNGVNIWAVSPPNGTAELYLTDVVATKIDGTGTTETLTVSIISAPKYKDLTDVQNDLLLETSQRKNADSSILQEFNAYRTAAEQNDIDNSIKSEKVSKSDFTNTTINPNGFVLLWLQPDFQADAVNISYGAMQPITGQFTPGNVALPFANVNAAGIMAKEDKQTLDDLTERMSFVEQGLSTERFVETKAALLAVDTTDMPVWTPYIVRSDSDHANAITKYYYNPSGVNPTANGFIFGIVIQEVPYTVATATMLGLVISSALDGKVQVEGTGAMSVNGWDALKSRTSTLETQQASQAQYNLNHDHSGGANGAVLPLPYKEYAAEAEASAATGILALYPV